MSCASRKAYSHNKYGWTFNWLIKWNSTKQSQTDKTKSPTPAAGDFHIKITFLVFFKFVHDATVRKVVSSLVQDHQEEEWFFWYPSSRAHPTCFKLNPKLNKDYAITNISKHPFLPDQTWIVGLISPYKGLKISHASLS